MSAQDNMKKITSRTLQRKFYNVIGEVPLVITKRIKAENKYITVKEYILLPYSEKLEFDYDKLKSYKETVKEMDLPKPEPLPEPIEDLRGVEELPLEDVKPEAEEKENQNFLRTLFRR